MQQIISIAKFQMMRACLHEVIKCFPSTPLLLGRKRLCIFTLIILLPERIQVPRIMKILSKLTKIVEFLHLKCSVLSCLTNNIC